MELPKGAHRGRESWFACGMVPCRLRQECTSQPNTKGAVMEATIGDQICIHGDIVGHEDKHGEIIEVHGSRGEPPYLVRFADGRTRLLFPGPDAVIVPRQRRDQEG